MMPDTSTVPSDWPVSPEFRGRYGTAEIDTAGRCVNPARVGGQLRPCRVCTSCAYATAREKAKRLARELDPLRPSYFVTLTYNDAEWRKLWLPPKPAGELTPAQAHQRHRWRKRIWELGERLRASEPGSPIALSLQSRIDYRQRRLDEFEMRARRELPARPSIRRRDGKLWQKRMLEALQAERPDAKLPRMVLKFERGSHGTRRPHIHVLMLHATPAELRAAVASWGHLRLDPEQAEKVKHGLSGGPFDGWRNVTRRYGQAEGRGHVHILPVTDEGVSTYVTKDLYRGQDATALEYIADGVEPPTIQWPRNPGIGCGGWLEYLHERWREWRDVYALTEVELELVLQDTRNRRLSLRHRVASVVPRGARDPVSGAPSEKATPVYHSCPPSVWRKFIDSIEEERPPLVRQQVADLLAARNSELDGDPSRELRRRHDALQAAEKRLRNWTSLCARKRVPLPTYAEREREFLRRRAVEARGGQIAAAVVNPETRQR